MTRQQWVDEVRSWVGTPFRWQGRVKGDGTDCWGLIVASGWACGLIPPTWDVKDYNRRTDLVALSEIHLPQFFESVSRETFEAGDVVTFHHGSGTMHMGVLYDHEHGGLGIVHSEDWRQIVQHRLAEDIAAKIGHVWRPRYE